MRSAANPLAKWQLRAAGGEVNSPVILSNIAPFETERFAFLKAAFVGRWKFPTEFVMVLAMTLPAVSRMSTLDVGSSTRVAGLAVLGSVHRTTRAEDLVGGLLTGCVASCSCGPVALRPTPSASRRLALRSPLWLAVPH